MKKKKVIMRSKKVEKKKYYGTAVKGIFIPENKKKYSGKKTIIYRSLWEKEFMTKLDRNDNILFWVSEHPVIQYFDPVSAKYRRYYPDFYYQDKRNNIKIIEVKPFNKLKIPLKNKMQWNTYLTLLKEYVINMEKWCATLTYCKKKNFEFTIHSKVYKKGSKNLVWKITKTEDIVFLTDVYRNTYCNIILRKIKEIEETKNKKDIVLIENINISNL